MRDRFGKDELEQLINRPPHMAVSIFVPTFQAGRETRGNHTRLKNLLNQADERLDAKGVRKPERDALLRPAQELVDNRGFWQHQSETLALFLDEERHDFYRLPLRVDEQVVVGDRFYVKPLMPLFSGDGRYYVLALSQNQSRLFAASRDGVRELDAQEMPGSLAEALAFEDPERELQMHTTGAPNQPGAQPGMFHGSGEGDPDWKNVLLRYFRAIDRGLNEHLRNDDKSTPLILAGVDYLHPIYREANTYNGLLKEGIKGNPEQWSAQEIHGKSWSVIADHFRQDEEQALERFAEMRSANLASTDLHEIVPAAHWGRIDTLFVAWDAVRWGTFDEDENLVVLTQEQGDDGEDLIDRIAVETYLKHGRVFALEPDRIPDGEPAAAIFRYQA